MIISQRPLPKIKPAPVLCVERAFVFLGEQYTCIPLLKMRSDAILRPFLKKKRAPTKSV